MRALLMASTPGPIAALIAAESDSGSERGTLVSLNEARSVSQIPVRPSRRRSTNSNCSISTGFRHQGRTTFRSPGLLKCRAEGEC
jgi:hypothetical protein